MISGFNTFRRCTNVMMMNIASDVAVAGLWIAMQTYRYHFEICYGIHVLATLSLQYRIPEYCGMLAHVLVIHTCLYYHTAIQLKMLCVDALTCLYCHIAIQFKMLCVDDLHICSLTMVLRTTITTLVYLRLLPVNWHHITIMWNTYTIEGYYSAHVFTLLN